MNQICQISDNLYLYVSMGSTTMKITMRFRFNKIITLGLLFLGFAQFAEAQWQFTQSSKKINTYDYQGLHVAYLQNGDYILCGNLIDTVSLDKNNTLIPKGSSGYFLARLNNQDSVIWKHVFETQGTKNTVVLSQNIQIIENKHIVIAGSFKGSITFPNNNSKSATISDAIWMRYDINGNFKALGTYPQAQINTLTVSPNLHIAIGGKINSNPANAFINVFDSLGNTVKLGTLIFKGTPQNRDMVNALCFGPDRSLYFAGSANGDSIGFGNIPYVDAPNNTNFNTLFFGKFHPDLSIAWLKAGTPMAGSRPYQFYIKKMMYQPLLNRVVYAGLFEGANFKIDNDTLAITSLVNTDSRKPILLCTDTAGKLIWHSSLELNTENQRGEIFTLSESQNGYIVTADIEHYLNNPLELGNVKFQFNNKAFLVIEIDSVGNIKKAFGTDPVKKYKVNTVLSAAFHPQYGLKTTLINSISDSIILPNIKIEKGSYLLSAYPCTLKASIQNNYPNLCNNEVPITVKGLPTGGRFTGSLVQSNGYVEPNKFQPGKYYLSYVVSDANNCESQAHDSITIHAPTAVKITPIDTVYCPKDTLITLNASVSGGSFSGMGVMGSKFNPSLAGTGIHSISYRYTNAMQCRSADSLMVRVKSNTECTKTNAFQNQKVATIKVYPNPNRGIITIKFPENCNHLDISLYDLQGKKRFEKQLSHSDSLALPVETGLYTLVLSHEKGSQNMRVWVE